MLDARATSPVKNPIVRVLVHTGDRGECCVTYFFFIEGNPMVRVLRAAQSGLHGASRGVQSDRALAAPDCSWAPLGLQVRLGGLWSDVLTAGWRHSQQAA